MEQIGSDLNELNVVLDRSQDPSLFDELRLEGPLQADFSVFEISDGSYRLEGSLKGAQLMTCVRTLDTFIRPFEVEATIEVVKDSSIREQVLEDEDEDLFRFLIPALQENVDISECVRQLVLLQEPISPVKEPSQDFSWKETEDKSDAPDATDPRWEKLKELKQKLEKPQ
jgi:uncharacterized protein